MTDRLDRALGRLPSWWNTDAGSVTYGWMNSVMSELDTFDAETALLVLSLQIDTAVGDEIDSIGALFKLARKPGETDTNYRARVKSAASVFRSSGTSPGIIDAIVNLTGLSPGSIDLTEDFPANPCQFTLTVTFETIPSLLLKDSVVQAIADSKAAGIYARFVPVIGGALLTDAVDIADSVTITLVTAGGFFTIEASLIEDATFIS